MRRWFLLVAVVLAACLGSPVFAAKYADASDYSKAVAKHAEGPYTACTITAGPFDLHRKYRSMEGPWLSYNFRVGDVINSEKVSLPESMVTFNEGSMGQPSMAATTNSESSGKCSGKRSLYWFKGLKVDVLDEHDKVMSSSEFLCHLNLDTDWMFRNRVFPEGERCNNTRIITVTQGQTQMCFPEGFGIPVASDEEWTINFQAANRTTDEHRRVKHRCTLLFVSDADLVHPIKALNWYAPFISVIVDKDSPEARKVDHMASPDCMGIASGVTAPNSVASSLRTDVMGRRLEGHWVVPPGKSTYSWPIVESEYPGFASKDRQIHYVWSHIHPCCTDVSLIDCHNPEKPIVNAKVDTKTKGGLQLLHIDTISSKEGIALKSGQHYQLKADYDNTTDVPLDSMVSVGIFFEDNTFARPDWVMANRNKEQFCGVSLTSEPVKEDKYFSQFPVFDPKIDGPLLNTPKTVELETSAGPVHIVLDPRMAPVHATQLYKLLTHGAFNGTPFYSYKPNYLIQTSFAESKAYGQPPISNEIRGLIRRLPLEVEPQVNGSLGHKKWALSMGREGDKDSATTSLCILLGELPDLDKNYTVFGYVVPDAITSKTLERMTSEWGAGQPWIVSAKESH